MVPRVHGSPKISKYEGTRRVKLPRSMCLNPRIRGAGNLLIHSFPNPANVEKGSGASPSCWAANLMRKRKEVLLIFWPNESRRPEKLRALPAGDHRYDRGASYIAE